MPALKNPRHEAFAQAVALNMPASAAWMKYVGKTKHSATVDPAASRLVKSCKVSARIAELRGKVAETAEKKFDLSKDEWLDRLFQISVKAESAEDYNAAIGALREIGKGAAHYAPEKVEHSGVSEIIIRKL
jgi:uncharacterized protein with PIN domain